MASQTPRIITGKTILRVLALLMLALLVFDLAMDIRLVKSIVVAGVTYSDLHAGSSRR